MCFHQDAGLRETDNEHKGSIFANAASVLSMAAEEISLDDHLEKELANEVELWRMETSSTAVHQSNDGAYRAVFSTNGPEAYGHSVDSASALDLPNYGMESEPECAGESDRGRQLGYDQVYSYGSSPRRSHPGDREVTGLSTNSTGQEYTMQTWRECSTGQSSVPGTSMSETREQTATSSQLYSGTDAGGAYAEEAYPAGPTETLDRRPPPQESGEVRGQLAADYPAAHGTFHPSKECDVPSGEYPSAPERGFTRERTALAPQAEPSDEPTMRDDTLVSESGVTLPVGGDSSAGGWLCSNLENDEAFPNEATSVTSSEEEDSFMGFQEDPLEKQMQAPSTPLTKIVGPAASDLEAGSGRSPANRMQQNTMKSPPKNQQPGWEGVRSDRSAF